MRKILAAIVAIAVLLSPIVAEAKSGKCPSCGDVKFWYPHNNR
jgi:hypothetical protein